MNTMSWNQGFVRDPQDGRLRDPETGFTKDDRTGLIYDKYGKPVYDSTAPMRLALEEERTRKAAEKPKTTPPMNRFDRPERHQASERPASPERPVSPGM